MINEARTQSDTATEGLAAAEGARRPADRPNDPAAVDNRPRSTLILLEATDDDVVCTDELCLPAEVGR